MTRHEPRLQRCRGLFRVSLATLSYGFYLNLLGILAVLELLRRQVRYPCLDPLTRFSLIGVSVMMILSTLTAIDRGEATLQLSHFLPFFWLFATLPVLVRSPSFQSQLARDVVLASMPINLVAIAEYAAKNNWLPTIFSQLGLVNAWQAAPHIGRAMVMFDHPNALANYLTICLGLGLGLVAAEMHGAAREESVGQLGARSLQTNRGSLSFSPWLWGATFLNLAGIFCSGSRNGILVALAQLLGLAMMVKWNRVVLLIGGLSVMGVSLSIFLLGLGQRSIGIAQVMDDPRIGVWKIALDLIAERPWLGWGPGSFKFLYPARLIDPEYSMVFHPHNLWLLLGAEYGIPITVALSITIGFICYRGVRAVGERSLSSSPGSTFFLPTKGDENSEEGDRFIFSGYALALGGSIGFSLLDVTLYDARINVMNWVLLSVIYSWTLKPSD